MKGQEERAKVVHPSEVDHLQQKFRHWQIKTWKIGKQTFHLVHFSNDLLEGSYASESAGTTPSLAQNTYPGPVGCHPLMLCHLAQVMLSRMLAANQQGLRTVHHNSRIINETMYHAQCLGNGHQSLFLGQSVQSLKHSLDIALSQQFLCKLLCRTLSYGS